MQLNTNAASGPVTGVKAHLLIMPNTVTAPTITSPALRKQNENYMWQSIILEPKSESGNVMYGKFDLGTKRSYEAGSRIVIIIENDSGIAFGAGARMYTLIDVYVVLG